MIRVDDTSIYSAISREQMTAMLPRLKMAWETLQKGTGAGQEFLGWVRLPETYDRAEFARIQQAARRIQKDSQALVVIGIGGSYLGARAVVELLQSPI